jgi:hypothetical protein
MIAHRSVALLHIPAEQQAPCEQCPAGTSPHKLTHRIAYIAGGLLRVQEDVCSARLYERHEHILTTEDPTADIDDAVLEQLAAANIVLLRTHITELEEENATLRDAIGEPTERERCA